MTKRKRVRAAFHGLETDHVPVCFWKHVPQELWQEDKFIEAQVDFYKKTDVDFVKLSADGYFGWPAPALGKLEQAKDLYQMKAFGPDHPFIREQIHRTKKIVSTLKDECCCLYLIFCPLSYLRLEIGYPRMMELIREDPEAVKHACRVIAGDVKLLVRGIIEEAGCDGIFYSVQNGEVNRFTYEEYREWVTPSDKEVLDYANTLSDMNALHCCAWEEINNRLEDWSDYDSAVVSWSRYIDGLGVSQAKDTFKRTVWGGFDNRLGSLLYSGTKEEIQAETKALIEEGGKRGFIIGPDCSIHDELPLERIRWVVETARSV